jgi:hypothetical protein
MKFNFIKYCLVTMSLIFAGLSFSACDDDIELSPNGNYDNIEGVYGYVRNITGARDLSTITIFGSKTGAGQLYFELSETATENVTVQLKVDEEALKTYNAANGTSYTMYPAAQVSLANNGSVTIASGDKKSGNVDITVSSNNGVGNTYALPISAEVTVGGAKVSAANQSYIYLIKPYAEIPSSDKGTGIKSVLYIEVNDENILNAGEYTMASSGKPFFDVVNIFAANINYNSETGRAYVNCNENVSHVLKNADQFIRPLQAKGIKVVLTILGNHDEAGVSNLSPEAAADFARELKSYVDVYGLDGVDFDDEYSKYKTSDPSPGFEVPSRAAAARLVYECRKIMPDKIVSFYDFGSYVAGGTVEGVGVGTLLDYAYWGYYSVWQDRHTSITGMEKSQYCPMPINLNYAEGNGGCNLSEAARLRSEKWGIQMFYNLKATTYEYSTLFNKLGNTLFDDDVEWTGRIYSKTDAVGSVTKPSYESYIGTWTLTPSQGLFWYTPGPWWDWKDNVSFTLRIEENVAGESYKVYGWGESGDGLPFIMDYNDYGRVEINLPQTVTDADGGQWQYVARQNYSTAYRYFILNDVEPAFIGYINSGGNFTIKSYKYNFTTIKTMAPAQFSGGALSNIYGGVYQDVAYEPYTLSK